jgi:hypothetical protein
MALKYEINMFETDPNDASKTFVTLLVTDDNKHAYAISKSVTTGSNTDAQNVGKTWNPDTESIE